MVYDMAGWENIIAEGRPLRGWWFKARRTWWVFLLTFAGGVAVGALKSEAIDFVKANFHKQPAPDAQQAPAPKLPNRNRGQ